MYEALISHLRECAKYDKTENTFKEAAEAIEELFREYESVSKNLVKSVELCRKLKKPKWIPVTERLPKIGDTVLCYCRANIYEVMSMHANGGWMGDGVMYMNSFVTHWMPLPKPPEEGAT